MDANDTQFVWVEKYRPKCLADIILPDATRAALTAAKAKGKSTNYIFAGTPGTGKTTVAKALAREWDSDVLVINASEDRGIDVLRNTIRNFASTMSFTGSMKVVILDEADALTLATQQALRAFIEEFAETTIFMLTVNDLAKILPAIQSRCSIVEFKVSSKERVALAKHYYKRVLEILTHEGIAFNEAIVRQVILEYQPDLRKILNEVQSHSMTGTLSEAILSQVKDKDLDDLFTAIKAKDFHAMRKWVALHDDVNLTMFYRQITEYLIKHAVPEQLPQLMVMLADYAWRGVALSVDPQLNMTACCCELFEVKFR